ncbi:phosphodiesterase [Micromonospora halophytica]|uniref:3',5'-cyclic AMP phosphodiesterase CpdA n=1 Tax=Micromonospora halophytica TaxID=47864 RepID=A0A1C5ICC6_9ACTN|nr:phosphodiesterase [Micromonospora halophytica]SCG56098.1 3',5'-cyclic AMP phosphodiesterase CpdA [Micromonospora halophytica]
MLVAQLSDPHLTTGVLAAAPAAGLHRALGRVLALRPRPDCVVISGDLVDQGRPDEYAALREVLGRYPLPVHLVTGNHDDRESLLDAFGGTPYLGGGFSAYYHVDHAELTVAALDSLVPGEGGGRLGEDQLGWLDGVLAGRPDVPALVFLHHPPVALGVPAADAIRLADGDALAAVIRRHPHVARVAAGHLHRPATTAFASTVLTVAPSTWRQASLTISPDEEIGWVDEPTAFLLHVVEPGGCVTHTVQVSHAAGLTCGF